MWDLAYWAAFLFAALMINISPGPELIFVLTRTVTHGSRHGFFSCLGTGSGSMVHVVMVAFGLAFILAKSLAAFTVIKILGAGYLIYLGIRALISKEAGMASIDKKESASGPSFDSFRKGVMVGLLNPKSVIFFMAFLPQFTRPDAISFSTQILVLGAVTVLMGIAFEIVAILTMTKVADTLFRKRSVARAIEKIMGSVLILLGFKLALSTHKD